MDCDGKPFCKGTMACFYLLDQAWMHSNGAGFNQLCDSLPLVRSELRNVCGHVVDCNTSCIVFQIILYLLQTIDFLYFSRET